MTLAVEGPVVIGEVRVVALVESSTRGTGAGSLFAVSGARQPVAVLIRHLDRVFAFTRDGKAMTEAEAERLAPGVLAILNGSPSLE
jgi:hypothetical protein